MFALLLFAAEARFLRLDGKDEFCKTGLMEASMETPRVCCPSFCSECTACARAEAFRRLLQAESGVTTSSSGFVAAIGAGPRRVLSKTSRPLRVLRNNTLERIDAEDAMRRAK